MNGLTWDCLQKRALPLPDRTLDKEEWRYRSANGFIGDNEHIQDLIKQDGIILSKIGFTKETIANLIKKLMENADKVIKGMNLPYRFSFQGQEIEVQKNWFVSPQFSLFYNEKELSSKFNEMWQHEYQFKNLSNHLCTTVGGDVEQGVVHYIEWIGFFEGGHPTNIYRVDPYIIVGLCTGKLYPETIQIFKEREEIKVNELKQEVSAVTSRMEEVEILLSSQECERLHGEYKWLEEHCTQCKEKLTNLVTSQANTIQELEYHMDAQSS